MSFSIRTLLTAALCVAGFSQLSCKVNDYCLECSRGDGSNGDGGMTGDGGDGGTGMDGSGSGSGGCIATNGGVEICDGKDNDCNGLIDDGTLPEVGDDCMNQVGDCAGGKKQCVTRFHCSITTTSSCTGANDTTSCPGTETCVPEDVTTDHIGCTKNPTPERCDGRDNDCNGQTDEGDPGGGSKCGTDQGECVAGVNHCVAGSVQCQGFIDHRMDPEICDAKDNDCDGSFDEGLTNMGSCGQSGTPPCMLGTLQCMGGAAQCVGAVDPTFEACDGVDNNCNGQIDEGYDKLNNPNTCGNSCMVCQVPPTFNANPTCANGTCSFACKPGYQNKDGNPANGCEFGPCFPSGVEVCDGEDNDCDGNVDESLTPPSICLTKGECAGTVAQCNAAGGWVCNYNSNVETDAQGNVVAQETRCDTKDNDCDGAVDESQPNLGQVCHDNAVGICETFGHFICDPSNLSGPAVCDNSQAGQQPAAHESCNNVDDDCDGNVDEDLDSPANTSPGLEFVNIGNGTRMAKYEMSKPDASAADAGSVTAHACSKAGVQPWTNVTYPQAVAACASIGARLCSEEEWHRTCSVVTPSAYPLAVSATGKLLEAEDFATNTFNPPTGTTHSWVEDSAPGFSGIADLLAIPNSGTTVTLANALTSAPRLDYPAVISTTGNLHVWVRMFANSSNADNIVYAGISTNATPVAPTKTLTAGITNAWAWVDSGNIAVTAGAQTQTISVFMGQDGVRIDQIYLIVGAGSPPNTTNPVGNKWAYASSQNTYNATTCNGHDYNFSTALTSETRSNNVVTVVTPAAHEFSIGSLVQIAGVADASFNGTFTVTAVPSPTSFTYSQTAANASSTGGTATDVGDSTLATGTLTSCYANLSANAHAFDLSGNVKEWVQAHQPGQNPIRGGGANNTGNGISCPLNFSLADDTFFFTNVGFRCCK